MRKELDLTHKRFGNLTVMFPSEVRKKYWDCRCACGKVVEVRSDNLQTGRTKSCGCGKRKAREKLYRPVLIQAAELGLTTEQDPFLVDWLNNLIEVFRSEK